MSVCLSINLPLSFSFSFFSSPEIDFLHRFKISLSDWIFCRNRWDRWTKVTTKTKTLIAFHQFIFFLKKGNNLFWFRPEMESLFCWTYFPTKTISSFSLPKQYSSYNLNLIEILYKYYIICKKSTFLLIVNCKGKTINFAKHMIIF
jgi:hypothetical protein